MQYLFLALVRTDRLEEAEAFLERMIAAGATPSAESFAFLVQAHAKAERAGAVRRRVRKDARRVDGRGVRVREDGRDGRRRRRRVGPRDAERERAGRAPHGDVDGAGVGPAAAAGPATRPRA